MLSDSLVGCDRRQVGEERRQTDLGGFQQRGRCGLFARWLAACRRQQQGHHCVRGRLRIRGENVLRIRRTHSKLILL